MSLSLSGVYLMGLDRHCSASRMFTETRLDTFNAIVRRRIGFLEKLEQNRNGSIRELVARITTTPMYIRWLEIVT